MSVIYHVRQRDVYPAFAILRAMIVNARPSVRSGRLSRRALAVAAAMAAGLALLMPFGAVKAGQTMAAAPVVHADA